MLFSACSSALEYELPGGDCDSGEDRLMERWWALDLQMLPWCECDDDEDGVFSGACACVRLCVRPPGYGLPIRRVTLYEHLLPSLVHLAHEGFSFVQRTLDAEHASHESFSFCFRDIPGLVLVSMTGLVVVETWR